MAIRAKFIGDGSQFHAGIPATDIEEEAYQALDVDQRKVVRESPLYDTKTDAEMRGSHDAPASKTKAQSKASKPAAKPATDPIAAPEVAAIPDPEPFAVWTPTPTVDELEDRPEDVAF